MSPWLAGVFVPEQFRGNGIGTALCAETIDMANKFGFTKLYLFTPNKDRFYKKQGWKTIERTVYRNEDVFIMQVDPSEKIASSSS